MEHEIICRLHGKKRLLNYPYRLFEIGWMPHHIYVHANTIITGCFICLSANAETDSETIVNGLRKHAFRNSAPHFGYIRPGTSMTSVRATYHDELFFHYPPECANAVEELLGPALGSETHFFFSAFPEEIIAAIRKEISNPDAPGVADRLDQLAIRLFTEIIVRRNADSNFVRANRMKLHSVAEGLSKGRELSGLLREYAFSERTFYREWKKVFQKSPTAYRIDQVLTTACALLSSTELSPAEIAAECGFSGTVYFYQLFKKKMHMTPLQFREKNQKKLFPNS